MKKIIAFLLVLALVLSLLCACGKNDAETGSDAEASENTVSENDGSNPETEYYEVKDEVNGCMITDNFYDIYAAKTIEDPETVFEFEGKKYDIAYTFTSENEFWGYEFNNFNVADDSVSELRIYADGKGFEISFNIKYVEEQTEKINDVLGEAAIIEISRKIAGKYVDLENNIYVSTAEKTGTVKGRSYYTVKTRLKLGGFVTDNGVNVHLNDAGVVEKVTYFTANVGNDTNVPKLDEGSLESSMKTLCAKHEGVDESEITEVDLKQNGLFVNADGKVCIEYYTKFECDIGLEGSLRKAGGGFRCFAIFE